MLKMQTIQSDEILELKTELSTIVETLSILHEFMESVFGPKFQSFCGGQRHTGGCGTGSPQAALRELRWKHLNSTSSENSVICSSVNVGHTGNIMEIGVDAEVARRLPMIASPEVVNVKLEVDDEDVPDFLDDVDPYSCDTLSGGFKQEMDHNFMSGLEEGERESQLRLAEFNSSSIFTNNVKSSSSSKSTSGQSRFVPGLIPIQHDPLHDMPTICDEEDSPNPSESSDEWQPSVASTGFNSQKTTKKRKRVKKPAVPKQSQKPGVPGLISPHLQRQSSSEAGGMEDGAFKCDQCPASYKQEESLRSHQKYKHNPSRVQCTCHLCGKSMVDKYRLQRHLRLHTGEKPFSCQYCGQRFYRKDYHTKHMQRKHGLSFPQSASTKPAPATNPVNNNNKSHQGRVQAKSELQRALKSNPVSGNTDDILISALPIPSSSSSPAALHHHYLNHNLNTRILDSISTDTPPSSASKDHSFVDYFSGDNAVSSSNLMTMASLTFDDLISADL